MKLNCLIVDDEELAQRVVEKYLNDVPELNLVKKCNNAIEAVSALRESEIDLVFLDINMPKISGLSFLRNLNNPPMVIITTAYREYALDGFELNVIDYLKKPFSFDRFYAALNKAIDKKQLWDKNTEKQSKPQTTPLLVDSSQEQFLFVKSEKITYKVDYQDIVYIESVGDYVKIITPQQVILSYQSLKQLETILSPRFFPRVHKSYIIAVAKISSIEGNTIKIGNTEIPIGRNYRPDFMSLIDSFSKKRE